MFRKESLVPFAALVIVCINIAYAQAPSRRAIVVDERISALREFPDVGAKIRQRLRRGRVVWVMQTRRSRDGYQYARVAVTRRTSGWIAERAIVSRGRDSDASRLLELIGETPDDFAKIRLARICADEFRGTPSAPKALALLAQAAERSADRLTLTARRRAGRDDEFLMANDIALDRFSKIGIRFKTIEGKLVYDGAAWCEIARRYPYFPAPYSCTR